MNADENSQIARSGTGHMNARVTGAGFVERRQRSSKPLLCFPDLLPADLSLALHQAGYVYSPVSNLPALNDANPNSSANPNLNASADAGSDPDNLARHWSGAIVVASGDIAGAIACCRQLRLREVPLSPLLLVISSDQLHELAMRDNLYDDFCILPVDHSEFLARLEHLNYTVGPIDDENIIEYGPLVLNLATYQAIISGRVLDLTYMEYELLRFLASHPAKVFSRETLLSRVWGYEYYGGARTVDVHVRRIRAKLGEEHAHLIQTVRSVGYRFGQTGWTTFTP